MPKLDKTFLFRTRVTIDVDISVKANSVEEASTRFNTGSWQSVSKPNWNNVRSWQTLALPFELPSKEVKS